MRRSWLHQCAAAGIAVMALAVSGCADATASAADGHQEPAVVAPIAGTDLSSVTLTERAAERLGVETATVTAAPGAAGQTRIPYGALLYDATGKTWAFTSTEPLVYVRAALVVAGIEGDWVTLSAGPPVGTSVVTVGAAELYGAELGVGH